MNIPKPIAEQMASLEAEIADIEASAAKRIRPLRERLDIYSFVVRAFVNEEIKAEPKPARVYASKSNYDYDALIEIIRNGPSDGTPRAALPIDHPSRLRVLQARGIAKKLPSGNWGIVA